MHWTIILIACLVGWALCATPWRKGSFVLALSWMMAQAIYLVTGDGMPVTFYVPADVAVLFAAVFWRTTWLDWLIVLAFPAQWIAYFSMGGAEQWWTLWALASLQMILAGPWANVIRALGSYSHGKRNSGIAGSLEA